MRKGGLVFWRPPFAIIEEKEMRILCKAGTVLFLKVHG